MLAGNGMILSAVAAVAAGASLFVHLLSCALAWRRCTGNPSPPPREGKLPAITIVQPHRGLEPFSHETLASIFNLNYPEYEIIFCVASEIDRVVPLLRQYIRSNPHRSARILLGEKVFSGNPKLNNIAKGWKAARNDWIVLADSNVLMPPDYLMRLLGRWRRNTGLVCSPPIGSRPIGFAAYVECAFLNTYQARWQYAAEAVGMGFAQGKTMLWRKQFLEHSGGIETLGAEIAEDAAATKLIRRAGLAAHLVNRPFPQPLGRRFMGDVWNRQVRWARLRRATFALYFLPELLTTSLVAIAGAALAAPAIVMSPAGAALLTGSAWYGAEAVLAYGAGWPLSRWSLPAWIARDLLLPWLWILGLASNRFEWRGAALTVADGALSTTRPEPSL